jgi:hypothetical protein
VPIGSGYPPEGEPRGHAGFVDVGSEQAAIRALGDQIGAVVRTVAAQPVATDGRSALVDFLDGASAQHLLEQYGYAAIFLFVMLGSAGMPPKARLIRSPSSPKAKQLMIPA